MARDSDREFFAASAEEDLAVPEAAARCERAAQSHFHVSLTAGCAFKAYDIVLTCDDGRFTARARTLAGLR